MYLAYRTVYYPEQQMRKTHTHIYTYMNNILYIVSTPTCFYASTLSSGILILLLC